MVITREPSSASPNSWTSAPNVLPLYGAFCAMVLISVSHASPIATSPGGSCFHSSRASLRPPQIVSCKEACKRIGCIGCIDPTTPPTFICCFTLEVRQQRTFNLLAKFLAHHNAINTVDLLTIFEENNRRNARYLPFVGQTGIVINVKSRECDTSQVFLAYRCELCIKDLAGVTFIGRKINQHHVFGLKHLFRKILTRDVDEACFLLYHTVLFIASIVSE